MVRVIKKILRCLATSLIVGGLCPVPHSPAVAQDSPWVKVRRESVDQVMQRYMGEIRRGVRPDASPGDDISVVGEDIFAAGKGIFRETVALTDRNGRTFCSGVLVDQFAVLTAAHCVCIGKLDRPSQGQVIVFDRNVAKNELNVPIDTDKTVFYHPEPGFCARLEKNPNAAAMGFDLALIFIKKFKIHYSPDLADWGKRNFLVTTDEAGGNPLEPVSIYFLPNGYGENGGEFINYWAEQVPDFEGIYLVSPARIATEKLYFSRFLTKLVAVGFGVNDLAVFQGTRNTQFTGIKVFAEIQIRHKLCRSDGVSRRFRCAPGREAILIDRSADTCHGDSGGPVFAMVGTQYFLVAVTSRGISGSRCGPGGVYSLVTPAVQNWMRANGVFLHSIPFQLQ